MLMTRIAIWMFSVGLMVLGAVTVSGQVYPDRPIRMVTQAVGSANDFVARLVAQGLTGNLGQQVIVDNRAVHIAVALIVAKAPPDGYTLLSSGTSIWLLPLLQDMPYDPMKDFTPISLTTRSINVLVVHPSLSVSSVKELIALAKAKPGVLNYASGGTGGIGHLTGELFKAMAGVNIVHVPYKGGSAALSDLITGQVQITFDNPATVMPLAKAGKLRALAVTTAEPSPLVPGLPTVASSGLPGYDSISMFGVWAPAKTPEVVIKRLNQEIVRLLNTADVKEKYFNRSMEVVHSSPQEFAATMKADTAKWRKVIKDADIKVD